MSENANDRRSFDVAWRRRSKEDDVLASTADDRRRVHSMTHLSNSRTRTVERTASVFATGTNPVRADAHARGSVGSPMQRRRRPRDDIHNWGSVPGDVPSESRIDDLLELLSEREGPGPASRQETTSSVDRAFMHTTPVNPNEDIPCSIDGSVEEIEHGTPGIVCVESGEEDYPMDTSFAIDRSEGLRKSIGEAFGWLTSAANRMHNSNARKIHNKREQSAVDSLEDLFLWHDVWKSGRAFFGGLYLILCIKVYLHTGIHIVQPSTVVASMALCVLAYTSLIKRFSLSGRIPSNMQNEAMLLDKLARGIVSMGHEAASTLPPFIALIARSVSGVQGPQSFYLGIALWAFMLIGELRILSQLGMLLLMYTSLFVLPLVYVESKWLLDGLAVAAWKTMLNSLRVEKRKELGLVVGLGIAISWMLDLGLVVRITAGIVGAASVLLWRMNTQIETEK
ncbi:hypothetical protein BSKO_04537 [Bryopsis sp. KO-2023]|nr:hypothetical protein BSKO_04537 [Bryopsis sp. KO-2023]